LFYLKVIYFENGWKGFRENLKTNILALFPFILFWFAIFFGILCTGTTIYSTITKMIPQPDEF